MKKLPFKRSKRGVSQFFVERELKSMVQSGDEISFKELVDSGSFKAGLIRFKRKQVLDDKYILHKRDDVLCYIISGHGILRVDDESKEVRPGSIIHIPYGNSHDFVADDELLVFYVKITKEN